MIVGAAGEKWTDGFLVGDEVSTVNLSDSCGGVDRALDVDSFSKMASACSLELVWKCRFAGLGPPMSIFTCLAFSEEKEATSFIPHF
jgi:hypothetical protein